jgi:hypothetical protein
MSYMITNFYLDNTFTVAYNFMKLSNLLIQLPHLQLKYKKLFINERQTYQLRVNSFTEVNLKCTFKLWIFCEFQEAVPAHQYVLQ